MYKILVVLIALFAILPSCKQLDTSVQAFNISNAQWYSTAKPTFTFVITNETSKYEMAFLIRHTNNYKYNNLFVNVAYNAAINYRRF